MDRLLNFLTYILGTTVLLLLVAFVIGFPVMWLWNWLMPVIFNLPTINFVQALGICLLSEFIFSAPSYGTNK